MINIYWPVYKNLERQFSELMFDIHIDDKQLEVYSLKISDLILRAAVEIESLAKELHYLNGGTKSSKHIKYDEVAIHHLNQLWLLEKKVVIISSPNCFLSKKLIYPFVKNELRTGKTTMTFGWNNAYQNIKHDRAIGLTFGSIKYLFDIMAALFILNVYYKNETFDLKRDKSAASFPMNLGSEIFSINLHKWAVMGPNGGYKKRADFDECIYFTKIKDKSSDKTLKAHKEMMLKQFELFIQHPKVMQKIADGSGTNFTGDDSMFDILGKDEYNKLLGKAGLGFIDVIQNTEFEAVLNTNQITNTIE